MIVSHFDFRRAPERFAWTPARISKLCERYGDSETFAHIASELGCTRSAAIGRFNRLRGEADMLLMGRHDDLVLMLEDDRDLDGIAAALRVPIAAVEVRFAEIRRGLGPQAR
jgi:hypothetical protein